MGERNRPRFFLLLLAQTILNSKAAFTMEEAVAWRDVSGGRERALALFLVLALLFVVSFCFLVFHAFLALTNMTTHEFLKADSLDYLHNTEDFDLPFSRGFWGTCASTSARTAPGPFLRRRPWAHVKWTRPSRVDRVRPRNPRQNSTGAAGGARCFACFA